MAHESYRDIQLPGKMLYEALQRTGEIGRRGMWEQLSDEDRSRFMVLAANAASSSPAPINLHVIQKLPYPMEDYKLILYSGVSKDELERTVDRFRGFLFACAEGYKRGVGL